MHKITKINHKLKIIIPGIKTSRIEITNSSNNFRIREDFKDKIIKIHIKINRLRINMLYLNSKQYISNNLFTNKIITNKDPINKIRINIINNLNKLKEITSSITITNKK
jgi:hypothetical protein